MKKIFVLLTGAMMVGIASAQILQQDESALVYYSPKTAVSLDFTYTIEKLQAGPFAEFAEELLGATDFVLADSITYSLKDVHIGTSTSTDYNRPHKVNVEAGIPLLLTINEKGILKGYNIPNGQEKNTPQRKSVNKEEGFAPICVAPLTEEILKATDSANVAEAVAQQILHIRETRMYLLSGEVEHAPADGTSMKLVLAELDKQEKALTALFVGKRATYTEHFHCTIKPEEEEQLFFFCSENGFTHSDNVDADTIRVTVALSTQQYIQPQVDVNQEEPSPKNKKTKNKKETETMKTELSPIVYNLPGSAEVKVLYKGHHMAQRILPIAQAGIDVPLPKALFTSEKLPVILFNEKTGNIISISK